MRWYCGYPGDRCCGYVDCGAYSGCAYGIVIGVSVVCVCTVDAAVVIVDVVIVSGVVVRWLLLMLCVLL